MTEVNLVKDEQQLLLGRAKQMRSIANATPDYNVYCLICKEKVFYLEDAIARIPGHIYSRMGMREFTRNSHCCEYHFDKMFPPDEDD